MSVAVQVVNGREPGAEEEDERLAADQARAAASASTAEERPPSSPKEEVMGDSELDQSGAPKKKKFKPWKSIRKIFKKKKGAKGSEGEGDSTQGPSKSMSKSTGELQMGGEEDRELNKRISMSEDSVFTPDKPAPTKEEVRNSFTLNTSNLADEINAKLKERASSSDDGYAQSSEDAMTVGDITHDNSDLAPSDSSKTDSGIITAEDEKSFTSIGAKEKQDVTADMKRLKKENVGDVDLDLIHGSKLLSSSAAKHRISVAPTRRRPSSRARTPQKRSSSRLDDAPSPIAEEPNTVPSKSPTPLDLDNEEKGDMPKSDAVPVVIIETPPPEDEARKEAPQGGTDEEEEEEPLPMKLPEPKEVIIIMRDSGEKKEAEKETEEKEKEERKVEEKEEERPTTPTSPLKPVELGEALEEESTSAESENKREETEKEREEAERKKKEEEDAAEVEERRLSVAASKALFEAKIPTPDPSKSPSKAVVNGNAPERRSSDSSEPMAETKASADAKTSEKEKVVTPVVKSDNILKDEGEEKEEEQPVSFKDRISRYQSLASKTATKGSVASNIASRTSTTKPRPASTSHLENRDAAKKFVPKVASKPSSTSSSKPKESTEPTPDSSKPSTNSSTKPPTTTSSSSSSSSPRKPLQPKIDRCIICESPVYPNEMSKFEGRVFHRNCQKCSGCGRALTLWNLDFVGDQLYCKQHAKVAKNNQLKDKLDQLIMP